MTRWCFLHLAKVNTIEWKCSQITVQLQLIQVCDRTPATSAKTANITKNYKNPKWPKKFKSGLGTVQKFKAVQKIQLRPKYEQIQKWPKKFKSGLSTVQNFKWSKNSITKKIQKYSIQYSKLD